MENFFFLALSPESLWHSSGFFGDTMGKATLRVVSDLPIHLLVLLALSLRLVVQARLGMLLW